MSSANPHQGAVADAMDDRESQSPSSSASASPALSHLHPPKPASATPKSERDKRTYRACLHCRQRKSRCDLYSSGQPGRPPCERCIREQHECVLGGSRRGGRRVKKTNSEETPRPAAPTPGTDSASRSLHIPPLRGDYHVQDPGEQRPMNWPSVDKESRVLPPLPAGPKLSVIDTVASHDIQNPADALEFLAHVAGRDSDDNQLAPIHGYTPSQRMSSTAPGLGVSPRGPDHARRGGTIDFPPLIRGHLSFEMIQTLLSRYEDKYHQFFPLANPAAFDVQNLAVIADREPHLLAAILTVASKDEKEWWQIHDVCSSHMQSLVSDLVYNGGGSVEAVEALLILAEWVPRRQSDANPTVGRGEEDHVAWMLVGTAIRLGYLLGIDRTGFSVEGEAQSAEVNRKRLAWAACYMSDRQISVRVGKAFWSRGPGPMTSLRAQNFPSLQPRRGQRDDFAAIFQANLELTQLFSNAHDMLYATKARSQQLNMGGEYVKYIDDLNSALRSWHSTWGILACSPPLKASLILSYEYLRLYINAFAYQATLNRLVAQAAKGEQKNPFGADLAATPDARFIYDSIDAAKSLISTFNSFVDPFETFRFMPLRYYLYVIYSACFLYKARATGGMGGGDSRGYVKRMIVDTIDRLQKASASANDVGDRYSRLVRLLWRKNPRAGGPADGADITRPTTAQAQRATGPMGEYQNQPMHAGGGGGGGGGGSSGGEQHAVPNINTFSWLDLPAVGEFAVTNNGSVADSDGFSGNFDGMMVPQYDPYVWNDLSGQAAIF